jgi:hypothetical protein
MLAYMNDKGRCFERLSRLLGAVLRGRRRRGALKGDDAAKRRYRGEFLAQHKDSMGQRRQARLGTVGPSSLALHGGNQCPALWKN